MATITGTHKNDRLLGTSGDDTINTQAGNDRVSARGGHDRVTGGPGNDHIDGGGGTDTAVFSGPQDGYAVQAEHGPVRIRDTDHQDGNDGQDIVQHVERLAFADATIYLVPNIPPVAGDDTLTTDEDSPVTVSAASLLANDCDADGDPLTITGLHTTGTLGGVSDNGDGTLTYDPGAAFQDLAAGESATDSFRYSVSDGQGGTDSATVTVTVSGADERPAVIDLGDLDGTNGFKMIGATGGDQAGFSVSSAGDVNGDGFDDVIVGAPFVDPFGYGSLVGAAYVVFGRESGFGTVDLGDLATGGKGSAIAGFDGSYDTAGWSVSSAGDINGDGLDDVIVGAPGLGDVGANLGKTYIVFGQSSPPGTVDLADLAAGIGGFRMIAEDAYDYAGSAVSSAGDVNGDGFDDVLIGAPNVARDGENYTGAVYVVFGKGSGFAPVELADIAAGKGGFLITDEGTNLFAGNSVAGPGDVNGDGLDDILVGSKVGDAAYVVFGRSSGSDTVHLSDVAGGTGGFAIQGAEAGGFDPINVGAAGDINGDNLADLTIGLPDENAAYVVFGKDGQTPIDLGDVAAGMGGFKILGEAAGDQAGISVAGAGDVNGDGLRDILVGASGNDAGGSNAGASYLVFGKASGFGTVDLDDVAAGVGGFKIVGEAAGDAAGGSVSAAGDVNHDGFNDLLVGATGNDAGGSFAGAAYVLFGGPSLAATTQVANHPPEDTLL